MQATGPTRGRDLASGNLIWRDIDGEDVARLLDGWQTAPNARRALADPMARYIRARLRDDELNDWMVAIIHNSTAGADQQVKLVRRNVGLTERAVYPQGLNLQDL